MSRASVLAIDLGTSRVKVALVDQDLVVRASASRPYATLTEEPGQAEQRVGDWTEGIRSALTELGEEASAARAVALTGQMPTLVALDANREVVGPAVTWQDSRADELVEARLDDAQRRRFAQLSGAPIDGRYLVPMHLRRGGLASTLLSARDYLFCWLTGELATEPSTASGYGVYDLARAAWSEELLGVLDVPSGLLPPVVGSTHHAPLLEDRLPGLRSGTPVVLGGADSVCAHHRLEQEVGPGISIIDGSSTVILATWPADRPRPEQVLVTPLAGPGRVGVEFDLLATGSSIGWLARIVGRSAAELEALALSHPDPAHCGALALPYLAGGEQGALWRSDLTGTLAGLTLSTSPADLALALFEAIAFETWRCLLATSLEGEPLTCVAAPDSGLLRPAILTHLAEAPVHALRGVSPSVLGAACLAFESLGLEAGGSAPLREVLPALDPHYSEVLGSRLERYLEVAPALSAAQR